jgi:hypothetical protein
MLRVMAIRTGSAFDMKATLMIYEEDLRAFPVEITRKVITDFRQGRFGNGRFAPSPGELAIECRRILEARQSIERARADQERLDAETIAARGRRANQHRDEDWRERAAREVEDFKRSAAAVSGSAVRNDDWAAQPRDPTKVSTYSDKLVRQLAGEEPIGAGNLGARPVNPSETAR